MDIFVQKLNSAFKLKFARLQNVEIHLDVP